MEIIPISHLVTYSFGQVIPTSHKAIFLFLAGALGTVLPSLRMWFEMKSHSHIILSLHKKTKGLMCVWGFLWPTCSSRCHLSLMIFIQRSL